MSLSLDTCARLAFISVSCHTAAEHFPNATSLSLQAWEYNLSSRLFWLSLRLRLPPPLTSPCCGCPAGGGGGGGLLLGSGGGMDLLGPSILTVKRLPCVAFLNGYSSGSIHYVSQCS